ncbi:hypothetical protein HPB50_024212 [Hyalomma asiaticum]|uniref:Uncharacterized protein n=1 Tax=Hyalomma asiaticum TaxID=266040 RepID=A0ACB7SPR0_HYAAI|nr:hypothetical protein HPB50_024212 [Hyalomma asiaticum]
MEVPYAVCCVAAAAAAVRVGGPGKGFEHNGRARPRGGPARDSRSGPSFGVVDYDNAAVSRRAGGNRGGRRRPFFGRCQRSCARLVRACPSALLFPFLPFRGASPLPLLSLFLYSRRLPVVLFLFLPSSASDSLFLFGSPFSSERLREKVRIAPVPLSILD